MSGVRSIVGRLLTASLLAGILAGCLAPRTAVADLVFRDATIVDGTGAASFRGDLAVLDGAIRELAAPNSLKARRIIDASGLILAPGFIDIHSHADLILLGSTDLQQRLLQAKIAQGVTTVVVGNCGLGVAPANDSAATLLAAVNGWMTPHGIDPGAMSVAEYLDRLESSGVVLNVATLVPHGPARISVMGLGGGEPDREGMDRIRALVSDGLQAGAFGVSTGLIYPPGMYSPTSELIELAGEAARLDRLFTSHIRGSSGTLLPATRELIEIAQASGVRMHHSHLEAVGNRYWPRIDEVLALEDRARVAGARISHDVFPYTRAATMMSAIFPPWALEGGVPALLQRLDDPEIRQRIRRDIESLEPEWPTWLDGAWPHNLVRAVGWDAIYLASTGRSGSSESIGMSLAAIARDAGRDPFDVVADLMLSQQGQVGQQVSEISGNESTVKPLLKILSHPAAAVITDAEDYGHGAPHPAHAGAFVRALRWNREQHLMPLEQMVRKMTGHPAQIVGLEDRGLIREGLPADLVLFDAASTRDHATWDQPRRQAGGVRYVVINGRIAVEGDTFHPGPLGRVLRANP